MTKEQKKVAEDIMRFIVSHGVQIYGNMITIPVDSNNGEDIGFEQLIGAFNYARKTDKRCTKRLPVTVSGEEDFGRFFIQYTNHNYVSGYKNLETGKVFPLNGEEKLSASGNSIIESLNNLWEKVDGNLGRFSFVSYSNDNDDILNNLDNE